MRSDGAKVAPIRYCDDFIIGFEREDDARRVMGVLGKRLRRYGPALHPDNTRSQPFRRPAVRDALAHVRRVLSIEINSSTDNPMVSSEDGEMVEVMTGTVQHLLADWL